MATSSSPRETIQISFGPSANAITCHLVNLEGLAATTGSSINGDTNLDGYYGADTSMSSTPYCDPLTTHYIQRNSGNGGGTWVPRVLMIDEATHHVPDTMMNSSQAITTAATSGSSLEAPWNGRVQNLVGIDGDYSGSNKSTTDSYFSAAQTLAYSPYSRYHHNIEQFNSGMTNQFSQSRLFQPVVSATYDKNNQDARHVNWDDVMEEEEEDEEERRERLARHADQERRRRLEWQTQTAVPLAREIDVLTEHRLVSLPSTKPAAASNSGSSSQSTSNNNLSSRGNRPLHWTDIWMPPRSEKSRLILPYSTQSKLVPHWDVIYGSGSSNSNSCDPPFLREWKQDILGEALRHTLEGCDYGIQGATITTEGTGIYASLTSFLLDILQDECKSAGRMVYHVRTNNNHNATFTTNASQLSGVEDKDEEESSWQQDQVRRVREQISSGLALYDFTQKAHAVLPLRLSDGNNAPNQVGTLAWLRKTAEVAMALEGCTLPFRYQSSGRNYNSRPQYQLGLQNAPFMTRDGSSIDTQWGNTVPRLTVPEYLAILQPSSSHSMLELDTLGTAASTSPCISNQQLLEAIQEGTSVERDIRLRDGGEHGYRRRPRDVLPGAWLQDRYKSSSDGGLLASLSYSSVDQEVTKNKDYDGMLWDRSAHHHFSLSTSIRQLFLSKNDDSSALTSYLTCLVESMGVRYRPERSMGTVLNQCLGHLTFGSNGNAHVAGCDTSTIYGAGVYWRHLLPAVDTPVVAVLGNTTRAYHSLNKIAADMKSAMRSPRFRGHFNRNVAIGVLPELEDCDEALEGCWNKRDVYQPPGGSGGLDHED